MCRVSQAPNRPGGFTERDEIWPEWYAAYMVAERAGTELPS
jgi:hypothetical protein